MSTPGAESFMTQAIRLVRFPLLIIAVLFAVKVAEQWFGWSLIYYGIQPREPGTIPGILTAPFVHGDWNHLFSNATGLFAMMFLINTFYPRVAVMTYFFTLIVSGIMVWFFARGNSYHIGASGVVYGLVSFVFFTGLFRKNPKSVVLALIMIVLYSGLVENLFPNDKKISWESHLSGVIAGFFAAFLFKNIREPDEVIAESASDEEERQYFLPRDAFEKTRKEREWEKMYNQFEN